MKTIEQADATAHALDLLPPDDPARSDPALRRNPALAEEVRATRELAADVWLSVAPLRTAPPGVLAAVLEKIDPSVGVRADGRMRWLPWFAASGWAAAAAVALVWWAWPYGGEPPQRAGTHGDGAQAGENLEVNTSPVPRQPTGKGTILRQEIQRLQARLAKQRNDSDARSTPRVMALLAPGGVRRSPEETRARVNALLVDALRSTLEAERAPTNDPVALVIERGWPLGGLAVPNEAELVRHRNFPELAWQELGMLRSDAGEYYDPTHGLIWSPDPEGRGFLGRRHTTDDDLARFSAEPATEGAPDKGLARSMTEGFLIEDPLSGTTQVVLDQLPPQAADTETVVRWTAAEGLQTASLNALLAADHSIANTGTMVLTLPNSIGLTSFQILAVPTLPDSGSPRVIVTSEP